MTPFVHIPVLRQSVREFLNLKAGDCAVDGTLGLGGHSSDICDAVGPQGHLYAFDQDENHLAFARDRLKNFSDRITFLHSNFSAMQEKLHEIGVTQVDGILLDLGLASPHVDDSSRGFSFLKDGPLDMRFDTSSDFPSAADLVNQLPEESLKKIFYEYGEERFAPKIARAIVTDRQLQSFTTTQQLADLIVRLYPAPLRHGRTHPATKVFQALRIAANRELEVLEHVLPQTVSLLKPGGRLVIISYHSLEDRIVKHFLKSQTIDCICPPEVLRCECQFQPPLKLLTRKPVVPTDQEIAENPRSRSAKLRVAQKN
jgi:16S rRNA (cytosine1402-N4)-methyltransferase